MEQFLALAVFGSFWWAVGLLTLLLVGFLISENVQHGGVAFTFLVIFLLINHFWGNIPILKFLTWQNILVYLAIGFVFANIKLYFYGRTAYILNDQDNDYNWNFIVKDNIFRWWFIWPISLIYWVFSDLLSDAWDWVYQKFESTFKFFYVLGVKSKPDNLNKNKGK
jgi:hypothetical protein